MKIKHEEVKNAYLPPPPPTDFLALPQSHVAESRQGQWWTWVFIPVHSNVVEKLITGIANRAQSKLPPNTIDIIPPDERHISLSRNFPLRFWSRSYDSMYALVSFRSLRLQQDSRSASLPSEGLNVHSEGSNGSSDFLFHWGKPSPRSPVKGIAV